MGNIKVKNGEMDAATAEAVASTLEDMRNISDAIERLHAQVELAAQQPLAELRRLEADLKIMKAELSSEFRRRSPFGGLSVEYEGYRAALKRSTRSFKVLPLPPSTIAELKDVSVDGKTLLITTLNPDAILAAEREGLLSIAVMERKGVLQEVTRKPSLMLKRS